jgi:hypothetical protein
MCIAEIEIESTNCIKEQIHMQHASLCISLSTFGSVIGSPIDGISRVVTTANDRDYNPRDVVRYQLHRRIMIDYLRFYVPLKNISLSRIN